MKKSTKIIIFIVILLIIIVPVVLFVLPQYEQYTFTITEIDGDRITAVEQAEGHYSFYEGAIKIKDVNAKEINVSDLEIGDIIYVQNIENSLLLEDYIDYACLVTDVNNKNIEVVLPETYYYFFNAEGANVKDINGHKINVADLKVGDTIKVLEKRDIIQNAVAYSFEGHQAEYLDTIKNIKVVSQDVNDLVAYATRNTVAKKIAVVVKVNEDSLDVMGIEDSNDLLTVNFAEEGNIGFKQGQEILIHFNGNIEDGKIVNTGKIEIIKEKSDIEIPESAIREFYSSIDNVELSINSITKTGIDFTIRDTNEIPYNFSNNYTISRKIVKEIPPVEDTWMTQSTISTERVEISWKEVQKISNITCESTGTFEEIDENTTRKIYDWSNLFGELESGEYEIIFSEEELNERIYISFELDENGKGTCTDMYIIK